MITASTRLFAVLGDPVAHSLSPSIQNRGLEAAGVDGVYVALRCTSVELEGLIQGIAGAGGGGNVTLPHKERAAQIVDEPSELVRRTGACNTFWLAEGRIRGENTDVAGFRGAVESLLGHSAADLNVLVLGAGGAARGALVGLIKDGVGAVSILNRTPARAERLASDVGADCVRVIGSDRDSGRDPYDLVINATSLGLAAEDESPLDLAAIPPPGALLDLVYRPGETALVRAARRLGVPAADGGEMLVRQGAAAFELWWDRPAPIGAMMAALDQVRGETGD